MKKNQAYIIVLILIAAIGGWFGYTFFFTKKNAASSGQPISAKSFLANSCWVYHEYVYRVDFSDQSLQPFLFIREADGTFSPSIADSAGNQIISNGFIIDSTGACAITEKTATPWKLTDEEQKPLRTLIDAWMDMKEDLVNKEYHITGQTVALFVVLNNPKEFIEYTVSSGVPGQQGYSIMYPLQKTLFTGIKPGFQFSAEDSNAGISILQVLKSTFDENNSEIPLTKTTIDSISVTKSNDGFLENIKVFSGDEFFYEGSAVFDQYGKFHGNLHYENKKWVLIPIGSFIQNPPAYTNNEIQEKWEYDSTILTWKRTYSQPINETTTSPETYKPGALEPTIKVYPSPTPK